MACEKVIIDQDNNVSLITFLDELKAGLPDIIAQQMPQAKPIAAMKWAAFSMWHKSEGEDNKEYQQRIALFDPANEPTGIGGRIEFKFGEKTTMRNTMTVLGFPIYAAGRYMLRLWMQEKGQPESAEPTAEYALTVKREQPKS